MKTSLKFEIEGKYKVDDFDLIRKILSSHNLTYSGTNTEDNGLYDICNVLKKRGSYLRLRSYCTDEHYQQFLLTYKGPNKGSSLNKRNEFEIQLNRIIFSILQHILPEKARYSKIRETYYSNDDNCIICLDEIKGIGKFVEIEAPAESMVHYWKKRMEISSPLIQEPYYVLNSSSK